MKSLSCKDAGLNCDAVFRGNTNDEVLSQATEHSRKAHGITNVTPEMCDQLTSKIKDEK